MVSGICSNSLFLMRFGMFPPFEISTFRYIKKLTELCAIRNAQEYQVTSCSDNR